MPRLARKLGTCRRRRQVERGGMRTSIQDRSKADNGIPLPFPISSASPAVALYLAIRLEGIRFVHTYALVCTEVRPNCTIIAMHLCFTWEAAYHLEKHYERGPWRSHWRKGLGHERLSSTSPHPRHRPVTWGDSGGPMIILQRFASGVRYGSMRTTGS